jgi:arylformamidase
MDEPIDISIRLAPGMPTWPGSHGLRLERSRSFEAGDTENVTRLDMDVHCGTHVEGPLHFINDGQAVDEFALSVFVGHAWVAHLPHARAIGSPELIGAGLPDRIERLLIRTGNSAFWADQSHTFRTDFAALTPDASTWIVDRGIRLIGVDYLSVQLFDGDPETHRILMRGGVAILEGLNLSEVAPGDYRLTCLPLRLTGVEAAPARAILEAIQ